MQSNYNHAADGDSVTGLSGLIAQRQVLVCCGAGGVSKTTVAAGLGWSLPRPVGRRWW